MENWYYSSFYDAAVKCNISKMEKMPDEFPVLSDKIQKPV